MTAALKAVESPGVISIDVRGLGWFPHARHPHTLWTGVEASPELAVLARATETAVEAIGVAREERKFSPHLTLARVRDRVDIKALRAAVDALGSPDFGSFSPSSFLLYESRDGKYTKIAEFPLI